MGICQVVCRAVNIFLVPIGNGEGQLHPHNLTTSLWKSSATHTDALLIIYKDTQSSFLFCKFDYISILLGASFSAGRADDIPKARFSYFTDSIR